MGQSEAVNGHVGGGVVAEDHHEGEGVAEGEREGRGEQAEDAGALDLILAGEGQTLVERGAAGADLPGGVEQDAELDDRSGLHGLVGVERGGLAGAQVARVEGDMAVMGLSDGLQLPVERLVLPRG